MRYRLRTLLIVLAIGPMVLAIAIGCNAPSQSNGEYVETKIGPSSLRSTILGNMPTNTDLRCTGITLVTEALLHVEPVTEGGCDVLDDIGQGIIDRVLTGRPLRYRANVLVESKVVPIVSRIAQDRLSTVVADLCKKAFAKTTSTEKGLAEFLAAGTSYIHASELFQVLDKHADCTDVFFGRGEREFPDGTVKGTSHVFLICKTAEGTTVVYDPNDPGVPYPCRINNSDDGVSVEWTCRYRETGKVATQAYFIVPKHIAMQGMFGVLQRPTL